MKRVIYLRERELYIEIFSEKNEEIEYAVSFALKDNIKWERSSDEDTFVTLDYIFNKDSTLEKSPLGYLRYISYHMLVSRGRTSTTYYKGKKKDDRKKFNCDDGYKVYSIYFMNYAHLGFELVEIINLCLAKGYDILNTEEIRDYCTYNIHDELKFIIDSLLSEGTPSKGLLEHNYVQNYKLFVDRNIKINMLNNYLYKSLENKGTLRNIALYNIIKLKEKNKKIRRINKIPEHIKMEMDGVMINDYFKIKYD